MWSFLHFILLTHIPVICDLRILLPSGMVLLLYWDQYCDWSFLLYSSNNWPCSTRGDGYLKQMMIITATSFSVLNKSRLVAYVGCNYINDLLIIIMLYLCFIYISGWRMHPISVIWQCRMLNWAKQKSVFCFAKHSKTQIPSKWGYLSTQSTILISRQWDAA